MDLILEGDPRKIVRGPLYKRVATDGKVYVGKDLAGQEVLVAVIEAVPQDKINYIKIGRTPKEE